MQVARILSRRESIVIGLLVIAILGTVTYGVVTYQTPYGCRPNGVAQGPSIDWQVLAEPCIYISFTGIVGGSVLLILFIPVPQKKSSSPRVDRVCHFPPCFVSYLWLEGLLR